MHDETSPNENNIHSDTPKNMEQNLNEEHTNPETIERENNEVLSPESAPIENVEQLETNSGECEVENPLAESTDNEVLKKIEEISVNFSQAFEFLSQEFQAKLKINAHKDEIIDKLHSEVEKYKNDFVRKLLTPALNELILLYDDILKTLTRVGDDGAKALDELSSLPIYIKDALFNLGVSDYLPVVNEETFSPRAHKIIGLVPTGNKEMDRKIAEVSKCGFMFEERVLRPAIVKVYKYDEVLSIKEDEIPSAENDSAITSDSISETQNV